MYITLNLIILRLMYLLVEDTTDHPLLLQAMQLARTSVSLKTQKSYRSSWCKWENFYQRYFEYTPLEQYYRTLTYTQFLGQLLMLVSYCVYEFKINIRSILGIIALFISHKVSGLFSVRRPLTPRSEARCGKHARPTSSSACTAYLGHDQPHHQHKHYFQRIHAESHLATGVSLA